MAVPQRLSSRRPFELMAWRCWAVVATARGAGRAGPVVGGAAGRIEGRAVGVEVAISRQHQLVGIAPAGGPPAPVGGVRWSLAVSGLSARVGSRALQGGNRAGRPVAQVPPARQGYALVELDVLPYRRPLWSAGRLEGVADGRDPDEAVAEHEGVDGVLDAVAAALGAPFQKEDVVLVGGGLEVAGGLRDLAEELGEGLADAVLAAEHAGLGDEDGVVAVVGDDLLQVLGAQRLRVVVEALLGASRRCHLALLSVTASANLARRSQQMPRPRTRGTPEMLPPSMTPSEPPESGPAGQRRGALRGPHPHLSSQKAFCDNRGHQASRWTRRQGRGRPWTGKARPPPPDGHSRSGWAVWGCGPGSSTSSRPSRSGRPSPRWGSWAGVGCGPGRYSAGRR